MDEVTLFRASQEYVNKSEDKADKVTGLRHYLLQINEVTLPYASEGFFFFLFQREQQVI